VPVVLLRTFISESIITSHRAYCHEPRWGTQLPN